MTPSQAFDALDLERGVLSVELVAPGAAAARTLLTPQGGTVDGPNGTRLVLAPGRRG